MSGELMTVKDGWGDEGNGRNNNRINDEHLFLVSHSTSNRNKMIDRSIYTIKRNKIIQNGYMLELEWAWEWEPLKIILVVLNYWEWIMICSLPITYHWQLVYWVWGWRNQECRGDGHGMMRMGWCENHGVTGDEGRKGEWQPQPEAIICRPTIN